jgi:hypothetical protein
MSLSRILKIIDEAIKELPKRDPVLCELKRSRSDLIVLVKSLQGVMNGDINPILKTGGKKAERAILSLAKKLRVAAADREKARP